MQETTEAPESRVYTHQRCHSETEVSGPEFKALSDPLADMQKTWCCECSDHFVLNEFTWTDTDEKITDYYDRHSRKASSTDRFLCSTNCLLILAVGGLLIGVVCGVLIGNAAGWLWGTISAVVLGLIGGVAGCIFREAVIAPRVLQRVCGVTDSRHLE